MLYQTLIYLIFFFLIDIHLAEITDERCFVTVCKSFVVIPMGVAHILPAVLLAELVLMVKTSMENSHYNIEYFTYPWFIKNLYICVYMCIYFNEGHLQLSF